VALQQFQGFTVGKLFEFLKKDMLGICRGVPDWWYIFIRGR
jgi:hypothetical protein